MLRLEGVQKSFGGKALLDSIDWFLGDRDRVGLVGRNGTGKSTLLRILCGLDRPDTGTVAAPKNQTVGFLPQFGFESGEGTVAEEARRAFDRVLGWKREQEEIEGRLAGGEPVRDELAQELVERHAELDDRFRQHDGYGIERAVHQVLTGLGFAEQEFDRPVRTLSGGWQMRVALARLLLGRPDVLLLDEPTNHLDIEARVWLEGFLAEYPGGFVLVSHDRHFLDKTITRITEIMHRRLVDYDGNYSSYLEQREVRYEAARKAYERQQEEIARIERFIERFRYKNTKAPQVQSRIKTLEKMEKLEPPVPPPRTIRFRFPQPEPSGRIVLRLEGIEKRYGDKTVFRGLDLEVERGQKIALVGPNGAGKSTLMRILAGEESLQAGERKVGYRVLSEFFAQDAADRLPQDTNLLDLTVDAAPVELVPQARSLLGAFLFRGEDVEKRVRVLSGGERNRLALMLMLLRPSNLLLLDEPTNHLDIDAQEVLLGALREFTGTIVFVSHDHYFLSRLADRVLEVGGGTIRDHPGDYESFLWKKQKEGEAEGKAAAAPTSPTEEGPAPEPTKERTRIDRRRQRRIDELEKRIGALEERRLKLEGLMATDGFFRDQEKSRFYLDEHRDVGEKLKGLYAEWEDLQDADR
ncbi:MAG: ATP-binding cassette domain-containing protein [Candidatus Eisenbacteria bacterium]|nr:ATP-binding cassette domain-containing protein [Candidatus Latescibacterota bacterium]MBD3300819.1 ATP-binding cassette domain-containing protein [Candidatus Eisenbacteria bacterium]